MSIFSPEEVSNIQRLIDSCDYSSLLLVEQLIQAHFDQKIIMLFAGSSVCIEYFVSLKIITTQYHKLKNLYKKHPYLPWTKWMHGGVVNTYILETKRDRNLNVKLKKLGLNIRFNVSMGGLILTDKTIIFDQLDIKKKAIKGNAKEKMFTRTLVKA